jgi:hypothetical protein
MLTSPTMSGGVLGPVLLDPQAAMRKSVSGQSRLESRWGMKPPVKEVVVVLEWPGRPKIPA